MSIMRREFLHKVVAGTGLALGAPRDLRASAPTDSAVPPSVRLGTPAGGHPQAGPDPLFEKPAPVTLGELAQRKIQGVAAVEVNDYAPGGFKGEISPSPPHADMNPKKAVIVLWQDHPQRLVFCHEASYDPWMELPNGVGLCNQFFEGNSGWAELFNNNGRKERNSFVDIIQSGPQRV